jgi:hypothetical protein
MAQPPTITVSTTDFLLNAPTSTTGGTDTFILKIDGFSENGVPIQVPGLNTSFGLYIEGTVDVQGAAYGPGTISLVLDPTNNDGTPSATFDPTTQSGSIGFSNPANTADDIVLATGSFVSGSFGTQSNGQPGVHFVETFQLNPAVFGPFLSQLSSSLDIEEFLFNTVINGVNTRQPVVASNGETYVLVNDGYGIVDFTQASVAGSNRPSFLSPEGNESGVSNSVWGTLVIQSNVLSELAAAHTLAADIVAAVGNTSAGSSAQLGGDALENLLPASASGSFNSSEPNSGWVHDVHSLYAPSLST